MTSATVIETKDTREPVCGGCRTDWFICYGPKYCGKHPMPINILIPSLIPQRQRGYRGEVSCALPGKCKVSTCDSKSIRFTEFKHCGPPIMIGYPDKEGNWHWHCDIGIPQVHFTCDQGHADHTLGYYQCWCGWDVSTGHVKPPNPLHKPDLMWVDPDLVPPQNVVVDTDVVMQL